jgi:GntR family transcriptional regulator, transcriptional repressor for pyruvate dehydrogenase complex
MRDDTSIGLTKTLITVLKDLMSDGSLTLGARLPAERELAERFGVHRGSLRQALKALETMGVLTQRVGDGTYLTNDAASILSTPMDFLIVVDGISFSELVEARLIVEPELAARAAERVSSSDLANLRAALDAMRASRNDRAKRAQHDLTFHETIARASGNRVCQRMFTAIHKATMKSMALTTAIDSYRDTMKYHEEIYQAIHDHRPEEAREHMRAHMLRARYVLASVTDRPRTNLSRRLAARVGKIAR